MLNHALSLTDDHREKQPNVEGHRDEHKQVADAELNEVENRLADVIAMYEI